MKKITLYTCFCFLFPAITFGQQPDSLKNYHPALLIFELGYKQSKIENDRVNSWLSQYGYHLNPAQRIDMELAIGSQVHKVGEFMLGMMGSILRQGEKSFGGYLSYSYPLLFAKRIAILPGIAAGLGKNDISPGKIPDDYQSHIPPGTSKLDIRQAFYFLSPALKTGIELGKNPDRGWGIFFQLGYDIYSTAEWRVGNVVGQGKGTSFHYIFSPTDVPNQGTKGWFMAISTHFRVDPERKRG